MYFCLKKMTWEKILEPIKNDIQYQKLWAEVEKEYQNFKCFPPKEKIFRALDLTPFQEIKVVIIGQDPYHNDFQADGLAFSVSNEVKTPPSLKNIFLELKQDLAIEKKTNDLTSWALQGVLLLNTSLSVRAHQPNSHQKLNWEFFTDFIIKEISNQKENIIFVLWGKPAQKKIKWIDTQKHFVIQSAHPSPLSAYRGFFGSSPFSKINQFLTEKNLKPIIW